MLHVSIRLLSSSSAFRSREEKKRSNKVNLNSIIYFYCSDRERCRFAAVPLRPTRMVIFWCFQSILGEKAQFPLCKREHFSRCKLEVQADVAGSMSTDFAPTHARAISTLRVDSVEPVSMNDDVDARERRCSEKTTLNGPAINFNSFPRLVFFGAVSTGRYLQVATRMSSTHHNAQDRPIYHNFPARREAKY